MRGADSLNNKLRNLVRRGVVTRSKYQNKQREYQIQLTKELILDNVAQLENYGFTSHPLDDSEAIVMSVGGNLSRAVVLMVNDRRHRLVIKKGEVAMFTHNGDKVHLKDDGTIHVKASTKVLMETPLAEFTGDIDVAGEATIGGIAFTPHVHDENDNGGPTGGPQ